MTLLTTSARAFAKRGIIQKQGLQSRLLSSRPLPYQDADADNENLMDASGKEVHHSFSMEETLESIFEMQRLGSDDTNNTTWERVVRSHLLPTSSADDHDTTTTLWNKDATQRLGHEQTDFGGNCRVCGRRDDRCDICSAGMIVSRFVPDSPKGK